MDYCFCFFKLFVLLYVGCFVAGDDSSSLTDSEYELLKSALLRQLAQHDDDKQIKQTLLEKLHGNATETTTQLMVVPTNSSNGCPEGEVACDIHSENRDQPLECIPLNKLCDNEADCVSGYDELRCFSCVKDIWHSIPLDNVCDGILHCVDGSDEAHCKRYCREEYYECPPLHEDGKPHCIPQQWLCDGYVDCDDFSDETIAQCGNVEDRCDPTDFVCSHKEFCIPQHWQCDETNDCGDDSDEDDCDESGNITDSHSVNKRVFLFHPTTPTFANHVNCGQQKNYKRIFGGSDAKKGDWPWQVQIFSMTGQRPFCGGSLISGKWVLTAAHCFQYRNPKWTHYVGVGRHHTHRKVKVPDSIIIKVYKIIVHPRHDRRRQYNDIALLQLKAEVPSHVHYNFICLPTKATNLKLSPNPIPEQGPNCHVTGFGLINFRRGRPTVLQTAEIPLITTEKCRKPYIYGPLIGRSMMCAGVLKGGVDACQGDSGGPLSCYNSTDDKWYQVGITSWGRGCARPNKPGVYTKVEDYMDWISSVVNRS